MRRTFHLLVVLILVMTYAPAFAVEPDEILSDPTLEARARTIGASLRCLVCQNQSIDDSNADLARNLRVLVRERLTEGDTNEQIFDFAVARYGEFILLKPPFKAKTVVLWAGPAGLLLIGIGGIAICFRRRALNTQPLPLSADEEQRLQALLYREQGER